MNEIDNKKGREEEDCQFNSMASDSLQYERVCTSVSIQLDVGDHQHLRSPTVVKFISNKMSEGGRFSNFVRKHLKQTSEIVAMEMKQKMKH